MRRLYEVALNITLEGFCTHDVQLTKMLDSVNLNNLKSLCIMYSAE